MIANNKKIMIVVLLLLSLIIISRIPIIPNEQGLDSFFVHNLARVIQQENYAKWSTSFLTVLGMTQFSYQSGAPFLIASLAQITNLNISQILIILSIVLPIIGSFGIYVFAQEYENNRAQSIIASIFFACSNLIFYYSYYSLSSRVLIAVCIPILLFALFKYEKTKNIKFAGTFVVLLLFCAIMHRMFLIAFSSIIPGYIFYKILQKGNSEKIRKTLPAIVTLLFILFFLVQFTNIPPFKNYKDTYREGFFASAGSGEDYIAGKLNNFALAINLIVDYASNLGIASVFLVLGTIHIILNLKNKETKNNDNLLLSLLLFGVPFLMFGYYTSFFYLPIFYLVASKGVSVFTVKFIPKINIQKNITIFAIVLLTITGTILITLHSFEIFPYFPEKIWVRDSTIKTINFVDKNLQGGVFTSDFFLNQRLRAFSNTSFLPANKHNDIAILYDNIVDVSTIKVKFRPQNLFTTAKRIIDYEGVDEATSYLDWSYLQFFPYQSPTSQKIREKYNLKYALENKRSTHLNRNIYEYISNSKNKIYDNSNEQIWMIDS